MTDGAPYRGFAGPYDLFMSVDYTGLVRYIRRLFRRFNASPDLLLDLGCGTGSAAVLFKALGYDVIGVDASPDMLAAAKAKDGKILFLNQDIRAFELYGTVDAAVSLCDVLNYIPNKTGLRKVFSLVRNYLNPGGLFIFDVNTVYKYKHILGDNSFSRVFTNGAYIWDNRYYEKERVNEYRLTCFTKRPDGCYDRFRELHRQRAYSLKTIADCLSESALKLLAVYGDRTFHKPASDAERVFFVAERTP